MKTQIEETKNGHQKVSSGAKPYTELKTDSPLSEKDEVKKAETRTRKALKDHF